MRLLYVHERFGALAGAETNVQITAEELGRRGHIIGIAHGAATGKGEARWLATFPSRYPLPSASAGSPIAAAIAEFQPDAIFVHKMADLSIIERLVASGLPLVRMVHDHDIYCMRSYKYAYFSRKICTRAFGPHCVLPCGAFVVRNANGALPLRWVSYFEKKRELELNRQFHRMIVVTRYMQRELLRNGFAKDRIEILPPIPRMGEAGVQSSFSDRNLIVFAGQIVRGKGVDVLLESLALVREPFECVILGDGNHRRHCEKLARRLGLDGRVHFKGFVSQEELKNFYRECSVVAISSVWPEPIATIGLEVMRYGLPVVAFDAGGISDWLQDGCNGFLVPWMDRATFAARIGQLLQNKALARQMGEQGRRFANERYDFDRYISDLDRLFTQVIAEASASRGNSIPCTSPIPRSFQHARG